jgi:DNA excision repair protein ERCC-3
MELKPDWEKRPIWITKDNKIFLETFNNLYRYAYEFIISIAMPISRP